MDTRISSGFTGPIASAVAGEVVRLTEHPSFFQSEGVAYKAAWDRAGSDARHHCEAFRRDCELASLAATAPAVLRELAGETFA